MVPFTAILKLFYSIFSNYGIAIILFSLAIKVILFPLSLKGKKSMIQFTRATTTRSHPGSICSSWMR